MFIRHKLLAPRRSPDPSVQVSAPFPMPQTPGTPSMTASAANRFVSDLFVNDDDATSQVARRTGKIFELFFC
jgi:hypothetical protein